MPIVRVPVGVDDLKTETPLPLPATPTFFRSVRGIVISSSTSISAFIVSCIVQYEHSRQWRFLLSESNGELDEGLGFNAPVNERT